MSEKRDPDVSWVQVGSLWDSVTDKRHPYTVTKYKSGKAILEMEDGPTFDLAEMRDAFNTPYNVRVPDGGFRKLDTFTPGQIDALYPFALVLACLDGNAFVNRENPEMDLVRQYIPEVFATLSDNGCVDLVEDGAIFRSDRSGTPT